MNVALFDYGAGNLHSLAKALEVAGGSRITVSVTSDWNAALSADALVLPGVGAFGAAVEALPPDSDRIRGALEGGLPCLGICLGMQLLFEGSDEAEGRGIGLIPGRVRRLRTSVVPQMGWNDVETAGDPLFRGVAPLVAYYANSFVCEPHPAPGAGGAGSARAGMEPPRPEGAGPADSATPAIAWSEYGGERFVAGVRQGRTWGVQFHPEKSSDGGLRLLANFLREGVR